MKKYTFASRVASASVDRAIRQSRLARRIGVLVTVCVAASAVVAVSSPAQAVDTGTVYESTVLADGPVAYWKFDETSGAFVDEVAGLELQESVGGSVVRDLPSLVPSADDRSIKLVSSVNGPVSESVTPGPGTILADEFTLEFWVDHDDTEGSGFLLLRSMGAAGAGWSFGTQNDKFRFVVQTTNAVVTQLWFPKASGHYVLTMDANYMKVFKDGEEIKSRSTTGTIVYSSSYGTEDHIKISGQGEGFDDLAIYDRALSAAEASEHALAGGYTRRIDAIFGALASTELTGDPVEASSGNFTDSWTDLAAPSGSFGMNFARTYNSLDQREGVLGKGWSTAIDSSVQLLANGDLGVRLANGRTVPFTVVAPNTFEGPLEFRGDLSTESDGSYRLSFFDGEVWDFDLDGNIEQLANWDGQTVTVSRHPAGQVDQMMLSTGYSLTMTYVGDRLDTVTSSDGRTVDYDYDANGFLDAITGTDGTVSSFDNDAEGQIREVFDAAGRRVILNEYDSLGRVIKQTTAAGNEVKFSYDLLNGTTTIEDVASGDVTTYKHSAGRQVIEVTDDNGNASLRTYTADGYLDGATDRNGMSAARIVDSRGNVESVTNRVGDTTEYDYDSLDRLERVRVWHDETQSWAETEYHYNGTERIPTQLDDPYDNTTHQTVVDGLITQTTDPDGVASTYAYNAQRLLTSVSVSGVTGSTTYVYDAAGRRSEMNTPEGVRTTWEYDDAGRLRFERRDPNTPGNVADDLVTETRYNAAGQITHAVDAIGATTTHDYDPITGLRRWTHDARGFCTFFQYNNAEASELAKVFAPDTAQLTGFATSAECSGLLPGPTHDGTGFAVTETVYGPLARVLQVIDPDGVVTDYTYTANGQVDTIAVAANTADAVVTNNTYDQEDRNIKVADVSNDGDTTTYNSMGLVSSVTNGAGETTDFEYDKKGSLTRTIHPDGGVETRTYTPAGRTDVITGANNVANDPTTPFTDPNRDVIDSDYDTAGRVTQITDGESGVTTFGYDNDSRTTSVTTAAGYTTTTTYDEFGRAETSTGPDQQTWTQTFTDRDEISEVKDPNGVVAQQFTYLATGQIETATDGIGNVTSYSYDGRGNQITLTGPDGQPWSSTYTAGGRLNTETDPLGNVTTYTYDLAGRPDTVIDPSNRVTDYDYDPVGRVDQITYTAGLSNFTYVASSETVDYRYDSADRRTSLDDERGTTTWTYDPAGRVDVVTYPGTEVWDYDYDKAGNQTRLTYPDTTTVDNVYDNNNRLISVDNDLGLTQYDLDADGRILNENLAGAANSRGYQRDSAGRVEQLDEDLDGTARFWTLEYDDRGRVVAHNDSNPATGDNDETFTYDNADQLLDMVRGLTSGDSNDRSYTYVNGRRATQDAGSSKSVVYTYDEAGKLITDFTNGNPKFHDYDEAGRNMVNYDFAEFEGLRYNEAGLLEASTVGSMFGPSSEVVREYDGDGLVREITVTDFATFSTETYDLTWDTNRAIPQIVSIKAQSSTEANYFYYGQNRIGYVDGDTNTTAIFSYDALGNTISTDGTDEYARSEFFDPYGDVYGTESTQDAYTPQFGYRSELTVGDHINLRNRHLHPETGLFTTTDPLAPVSGSAVTANPYHYTNNNPTNLTDPLGLRPKDEAFDLAGLYDLPVLAKWVAAGYNVTPESSFLPRGEPYSRATVIDPDNGATAAIYTRGSTASPGGWEWSPWVGPPTPSLNSPNVSGALGDGLGPSQATWCVRNLPECPNTVFNQGRAEDRTKALLAQGVLNRRNRNAFLHAYWSGLNTRTAGASDARALGFAHEDDKSDGYVDTKRDLLNNDVGIAAVEALIAEADHPWVAVAVSRQDVEDAVLAELEEGTLSCLDGFAIVSC